MIRIYAIAALVAAGAGGFWYVSALQSSKAALQAALSASEANIAVCIARLTEGAIDRSRDDAIDKIPDAGLRDAAREWLLDPETD